MTWIHYYSSRICCFDLIYINTKLYVLYTWVSIDEVILNNVELAWYIHVVVRLERLFITYPRLSCLDSPHGRLNATPLAYSDI